MLRHEWFSWDTAKARTNLAKHGIGFETAAEVLADPAAERFHASGYDLLHSHTEDRWITVGSHPRRRSLVLVIAWTLRQEQDRAVTRIVSARKANRSERRQYEEEVYR